MPPLSVAIVGRPNVGKSTLFNRLVGSRIAIEAEVPGVTRDRVTYLLSLGERTFELLDTGGIGMVDSQKLEDRIEKQIAVAIEEADVLIFLVDARDEVTPLDTEVAARLRKTEKPVILAANKVDNARLEDKLPSFHALGFGDAIALSAKENRNIDDLEGAIVAALPPAEEEPEDARGLPRIAFVGRRNAGKSTVINQLIGSERVIVSDIPGTTRDAVDIVIERDGRRFVAIDTAGLRRRKQYVDVMEFYGTVRTERAIRRADAVVLLLDALGEISQIDRRIGGMVVDAHKPCIVALNKWDAVKEEKPTVAVADYQDYVADRLPGMYYCRLAGISAQTGENIWPLVEAAHELIAQAAREVNTGRVNKAIELAYAKRRPKPHKGRLGKIYYGTQAGVSPPTFLLFCNDPAAFDGNYRRYLANQFRQHLGYEEVPVKLIFKVSPDKEVGRYGRRT